MYAAHCQTLMIIISFYQGIHIVFMFAHSHSPPLIIIIQIIPDRYFRPPETGGTRWKKPGKLLDPTGKHRKNKRKMEAVFRSYVLGFLPVISSPFPAKNSPENGHKSSKHVYYSSGNGRTPPGNIQ